MGANNTQETQQQSVFPNTPSWLTPYYKGGANQATNAQAALPSLSSLYGGVPLLGVPGLTSAQTSDINQFQSAVGPNASTTAGMGGLQNFIGKNGQPSSATNAALNEFKSLTAPEINQQSVLMGQGNSGAADAALAMGQEAALVPFMQGDLSNQLTASGQLMQGGQNQSQIQQSQLMNALQAAGMPREVATQQAQALYDQQQQKWNFAQGIQSGPLSGFSSLIGQLQNMTKITTGPKF